MRMLFQWEAARLTPQIVRLLEHGTLKGGFLSEGFPGMLRSPFDSRELDRLHRQNQDV